MPPSPAFDPVADWHAALPPGALAPQPALRAILDQAPQPARDLLAARYAITTVDPRIPEFLRHIASAGGAELLERMLAALIAADHFNARVPCPRPWLRRLRARTWQPYEASRAQALGGLWVSVLAAWTAWQYIPENWLPRELVFAAIHDRLRVLGFEDLELTGDLRPPQPGGAPGLREACAADRAALPQRTQSAATAVILFRDAGPEAAVVDSARLAAALALPGVFLGPDCVPPPAGLWLRLLRSCGAATAWWRLVRQLRRL